MENENNYTPETNEEPVMPVEENQEPEIPAAEGDTYYAAEEESYYAADETTYYGADEVPYYGADEAPYYGEYQNPVPEKKSNLKKILLPIILGTAGLLTIIAIVFTVLIVGVLNDPRHHMEKGNYAKAYEVAKENEKFDVLYENIVAFSSADCVSRLKDAESFELETAWINELPKIVILQVRANNSYGNSVLNYWYYSYDEETGQFEFVDSYVNFDEETTYSWDDSDERLEKAVNNLLKSIAKGVVSSGEELDEESVDAINELFENEILEDVEFLSDEYDEFIAEKDGE